MLASPEYVELQRRLHAERPDYGDGGHVYAPMVEALAKKYKCTTVLDYGCGKGRLKSELELPGVEVREYDPAIAGKDALPQRAQIVVCTDVLEHVEPENLDDVLEHLQWLTDTRLLVAVHCGPAVKKLADGRNAHLIQQPPQWWLERLFENRFDLEYFNTTETGFVAVMK